MHGMILSELRNYAETKLGPGTWDTLLLKANLEGRVYLAIQQYADADAIALVMALSGATGLPLSAVLEDFGLFLAPSLMDMYGHLLKPEWRAIDVIENTEATVHSVVRVKDPSAKPPRLSTQRVGPNEVLLVYTSPRRMCGLAIGIGKGVGQYFHEAIVATETMCMHKGATRCEILFRTLEW
jgi:Haem-NO-binding